MEIPQHLGRILDVTFLGSPRGCFGPGPGDFPGGSPGGPPGRLPGDSPRGFHEGLPMRYLGKRIEGIPQGTQGRLKGSPPQFILPPLNSAGYLHPLEPLTS